MRAPEQSFRSEADARGDATLGAAANKAEEAAERRQLFQGPQAARAPQRAAEAPAPATLTVEEPPEKWGERIMALRRDGRTDEADTLLAAFRKRHPDYPVPEAWLR